MTERSKKKVKAAPLLMVDWDDTSSPETSEWKDIEEDTVDGVVRVRSVGYLGFRDKRQIILIQTVSEDKGFFGDLAIPMGCVTKIRRLR